MKPSFLHDRCKDGMCEDCISIAEEYQTLLDLRTRALQTAEYKREELQKKYESEKRRADMYESVAKAGIGDIIAAWIDKEIKSLLEDKQR